MQWTGVRPDTLIEGPISAYSAHDGPVDSIFSAGRTTMANVAHFTCTLAAESGEWERWRGRMPVVTDDSSS